MRGPQVTFSKIRDLVSAADFGELGDRDVYQTDE